MSEVHKLAYQVLAFYCLVDIEFPKREVKRFKKFIDSLSGMGRIYIGKAGINGVLSLKDEQVPLFEEWVHSDERFEKMPIKPQPYHTHAFEKLIVKERDEIVGYDPDLDLSKRGKHISPEEWKKRLDEKDENTLLLDVRNQFEYEVGHFEGALAPKCDTFREFKYLLKDLKKKYDPETTPVMMSCTGGIRCEFFSAAMIEEGYKDISQLDGGVINYGNKVGGKHWKGSLFVFDDRMTVPISDEPSEVVGRCSMCHTPTDEMYNCANMDCNKLMTVCPKCIEENEGTCGSEACVKSQRLRPLSDQNPHKPFRKWYNYSKNKEMTEPLAK